jgi:hypothetical protein
MRKIAIKESRSIPHLRQSARGVEIMNLMEMITEAKPAVTHRHLSPIEKLTKLAKQYPHNKFYKSLLQQKMNLSQKQQSFINLDYTQKILNK